MDMEELLRLRQALSRISALRSGEDYATVGDLLASEDLPETTIRIWGKAIRVRGLTLGEREEIRATAWREDGQRDFVALVRGYLQHGITAPRMNDEQLDRFMRKHAGSVEHIYLFIDRLTEVDYDLVIAQAKALAGLAPGAEPAAADGAAGADDRSVDRPPRRAARRPSPQPAAAD